MPTPDDRALDFFFVIDGMDLLYMKKKQVEVCKKIEYSMQLNASRIEYSMQPASANVFEAHKHNSTPIMLIKVKPVILSLFLILFVGMGGGMKVKREKERKRTRRVLN